MTREVTKMKQMNQKTRTTKTIKSTWRKTGQCRTATQFTTIITARWSKHQQRIREGLISLSQGVGGRDGQTGGSTFLQTQNGRYHEDVRHCYSHDTETHSHTLIGFLPGHGNQTEQYSLQSGIWLLSLCPLKKETLPVSIGRREKCGHEGDDAASLLAFLVVCLRAMPTMAGEISFLHQSYLALLSFIVWQGESDLSWK